MPKGLLILKDEIFHKILGIFDMLNTAQSCWRHQSFDSPPCLDLYNVANIVDNTVEPYLINPTEAVLKG